MKIFLSVALMIVLSISSSFAKAEGIAIEQNAIQFVTLEISNGDTVLQLTAKDTISLKIAPEKTESLSKEQKKKKLLAGFLSFPFPLGFLGTHRIMMGTKPWVPIAYVATFGGCFGLLPLIDFCVIMFSDNVEQYENNPNIFMWIK